MAERQTTANFRIGDAFPSGDASGRYVVRLSIALGDLRIAAAPLLRGDDEITDYERFYFVRLLASHMYEAVLLITPRGRRSVLPGVDGFLAEFGDRQREAQDAIRDAHAEITRRLAERFELRPALT